MPESLLLTSMWEHEGQFVANAVRLGDGLASDVPTKRMHGIFRCPSRAGLQEIAGSLEEFKGPTEVYYGDDGERIVCIAGRWLGSGLNGAYEMAANSVVMFVEPALSGGPWVF